MSPARSVIDGISESESRCPASHGYVSEPDAPGFGDSRRVVLNSRTEATIGEVLSVDACCVDMVISLLYSWIREGPNHLVAVVS